MNSKFLKRAIMIVAVLVLMLGLASCGGDKYVTVDKYNELSAADWSHMSQEDMEKFLGVKGVVDEEDTANWGEGYAVVDFPGPDEDSYLHVLFKEYDTGWGASSMSPVGALAE